MFRRDYDRIAEAHRPFWTSFNESFWSHVVAAVAERFRAPCHEVFGPLYYEHLALDHPFTLMQADENFAGHSMHQHFYHAPHWAFTILLYIDHDDTVSRGTTLHRLLPAAGPNEDSSSYQTADLPWRAQVAIDTFHWLDPAKPDRRYEDVTCQYRCNRLFVFMDGPLALHSVPFDRPDRTPDPRRSEDGGRHARRRILRSHVKVHHDPYYRWHSKRLPQALEPNTFMRVLAPNAVLTDTERHYVETVLKPFFLERVAAYARAARSVRGRGWIEPLAKVREWLGGPARSHDAFVTQIASRLP
jgi:hypothetical protein